ncbi:MAG: pirin family protein [Bacteroidetes bacterium]|nr:pirin family protein [Bacteroidota bacterium]
MKTVIHKSESRGSADHGWLKAKHSFSFAGYYDPARVHFGMLRVLNDDIIAGGMGFGMHPHDNMEIVTIPLRGSLAHKDNMGNASTIVAGEVQVMSAGTGVMHSEVNSAKEEVNLLQIWVMPKFKDIEPRYDQRTFSIDDRNNKFYTVVSGDKEDKDALWMNQDGRFSLANMDESTQLNYHTKWEGNGMYFFVIEGEVTIADTVLGRRDAIGISEANEITITANTKAEILCIEVPMN